MNDKIRIKDINSNLLNDEGDSWHNLTLQAVSEDNEILIAEYEDREHPTDYYEGLNEDEKIEHILESDIFSEIKESHQPVVGDYIYLLQNKPTSEQVLKVCQNAPHMVIIQNDENRHYIGLSGGSMDFKEGFAYAYMIIDNYIPPGFRVKESARYLISDEAHKELTAFTKLNKGGK